MIISNRLRRYTRLPSKYESSTALILAGGLSSRMGREKATLTIESKPLISWAYDTAIRFADHIYISTHDDRGADRLRPLLPYGATYLFDLYDGPRSVLLALLSCFRQIHEGHVAVFPVDSPFVNPTVMFEMISKCQEYDVVIPLWPDGKLEAIHAIYNTTTMLPVVEDLWRNKTLELWQVAKKAKKTLFISTESLAELDPPLLSLLDADTPEEFEALKAAKPNHT
jgi:molybdopterin-guanine dinucleotide biosynthesis protein A